MKTTIVFLLALALALTLVNLEARAFDVEYVDSFPKEEDFIETEHDGGFCEDGRVYGIIFYEHETETNIVYSEYFLHPETEVPKVVIIIEIDLDTSETLYDIYIRNNEQIEHYKEAAAFREAYPGGVCNPRVDQEDL